MCEPKTSCGQLSWDDAPSSVSESHHGVTATSLVLPEVGSCESAARSSTEGSSSRNTFVQVTRPDDVFGTHTSIDLYPRWTGTRSTSDLVFPFGDPEVWAEDGIRSRDPHLGKVVDLAHLVRCLSARLLLSPEFGEVEVAANDKLATKSTHGTRNPPRDNDPILGL